MDTNWLVICNISNGSVLSPFHRANPHLLCALQVRHQAATAVVSIDARPRPDTASLKQLADHLEQVLTGQGSTIVQGSRISKAVKDAPRSLAESATSSYMYI